MRFDSESLFLEFGMYIDDYCHFIHIHVIINNFDVVKCFLNL